MQKVVTTRQANVTAVLMTRSSGHGRLAQRSTRRTPQMRSASGRPGAATTSVSATGTGGASTSSPGVPTR